MSGLLTSISAANEVLISNRPGYYEKSTSGGISKERLRTQKILEYRFLTQAAAEAAAAAIYTDIAGDILTDGTATSPTIHLDGFDAATGTIYPGISVKFEGDDVTYYVLSVATIAANEVDVVLASHYLEPGTILVNGGSQTGTTLNIDGFTNTTGFVRMGTKLEIAGDATDYTVTAQVQIAANAAAVVITPTLAATPADDAAVTLTYPAADNTPVTLGTQGVSGVINRAGESGAYKFTLATDYFPNGNLWVNA